MAKIEIDLSDFSTYDIIDHLKDKGYLVFLNDQDAADYLEDQGWYVNEYIDNDKLSEFDASDLKDELEDR